LCSKPPFRIIRAFVLKGIIAKKKTPLFLLFKSHAQKGAEASEKKKAPDINKIGARNMSSYFTLMG